MQDLHLDSSDLGETEDFLVRAYTMRISGGGARSRTRIRRRRLGPVSFDELSFTYDMSYDANPPEKVLLCRVHSGRIENDVVGGPTDVAAAGDLTLVSLPELPYSGRVCAATYDLTGFDPTTLNRVAGTASGGGDEPVRLTGRRPVSAAAANRLSALIDYLRDGLVADPETPVSPVLEGTVASLLAVATLQAFPNNATFDPTPTDRNDGTKPALLRRAMVYMDDNAHTDISLADIAAHVCITPRALQYLFRRQMECTPTEYLRRVRLERAHQELVRSSRAVTTVGEVAARWGFAHASRFARHYRKSYGRSPYETLRS